MTSGSPAPRIREAGDSALLLELEPVIDAAVNGRAIAIAAAVRAAEIPGVRDVVSTFRSVAVYFDPLVAARAPVRRLLEETCSRPASIHQGRSIAVPVVYGGAFGPDLAEVAAFAGLDSQAVIDRHAGAEYRVFMLGFLPGFAYMASVDPQIAAPRRSTPRVRVPAGSVGIAGVQTGIYPRESPGGWQIIGRTPLRVFDPERTPASLFAPGDVVRFVEDSAPGDPEPGPPGLGAEAASIHHAKAAGPYVLPGDAERYVTIIRPGLFTTVQDCGRWGHQASGVPVGGAIDQVSHRVANAIVGNDRDAATLEATLVGPELRIEQAATIAVAGADLSATLDGARVPLNEAIRSGAGSLLRFGDRRAGARAYVAFDGGIAVPTVLGSRATHVLSALGGVGGRPLAAGDRVALGATTQGSGARRGGLSTVARPGGVRVRILPGPHEDFFPDAALEMLVRTRFTVAPQSNRMGYRLHGGRVPRLDDREMISDATFTGAIQVPPSGDPILLMADRQTAGGYPQLATIVTADLPLAAQLAPGDWIEFQVCSRADALYALIAQEGKLLAIG